MTFFARIYDTDAAALAAYRDVVRTLDSIEADSYALVVEIEGTDVLVVGVDEPDAFLDAQLPASWLEAPAYRLSDQARAALWRRREIHDITRGVDAVRTDEIYDQPYKLGPEGQVLED
jgi:hypothetical protein